MPNGPFSSSNSPGPFSNSSGGGGTTIVEVPIDATAFYLHTLTLGSPVADVQGSLMGASMQANGVQIQLQDGAGATPLTMNNAVCWSWPIPDDIAGNGLSTLNLNHNMCLMAILERAVSALPMNVGFAIGFCEGADPTDGSGQGIAVGLEYNSTTLRSVAVWRRVTGTWTRQVSAAGQSTCFGSELRTQPSGTVNIADCKGLPLDASFNHNTIQTNTVSMTANVASDLMDHLFIAAYWTSAAAGTPQFTIDGTVQIVPYLPHV